MKICFAGMFLLMSCPAKENVTSVAAPSATPTPIDCDGLKNTFWLTLESNSEIDLLIVNLFVKNSTFDPSGWIVPKEESRSLWIVNIFKFL